MNKTIFSILFLLFVLPYSINAQKDKHGTNSDTISIRFNELLDIDYRFKIILDDFIKHMPFKLHKHRRKNYIYVNINAYLTYRAPASLIDSLYQDNDFKKSIYLFPYDAYLGCIKKESREWLSIAEFQQSYLYNYKGFDVIIVSPLQLEFPWVGSSVTKQCVVPKNQDFSATYYSVYTIGDFEVIKRKYIKLYSQPSGVPLKKKYSFDKGKSDLLRRK